jgi:hypothetical protein
MDLKELKDREEKLIKAERELKRKRIRDKIADLMIVVTILGVTFYNVSTGKQAEKICTQKYEEMILGTKKENMMSNMTEKEMLENLKELNVTCLTH